MKPEEVCGVVISYHPTRQLATNVQRLAEQVGHVVIVDNTPGCDPPQAIEELNNPGGCTIIRNRENLGVAAALNIGIRHAIGLGFSWLVTFDQDSRIGEGYIEAMLATYREAEAHAKVGMLCPRYVDARLGVFLPTRRAANGDVSGCMTSGAMIHANVFMSAGPIEEALFIDYVDHEYCLRLRSAGYKLIECQEAELQHSLGRISYETILGRMISTTNHSPKRRYYIYRNRLVLIKRYLLRDTEWAFYELKALIKDSVKIVLVERQKIAKLGYIARAVFDGLLGRLGPRVEL